MIATQKLRLISEQFLLIRVDWAMRLRFVRVISIFLLGTSWNLSFANQTAELVGYVGADSAHCFSPEPHDHDIIYYVKNEKTGQETRLFGADSMLNQLSPGQKVRVSGEATFAPKPRLRGALASTFSETVPIQMHINALEIISEPESLALELLSAESSDTPHMLSCLLVFVSTQTGDCMVEVENVLDLLWYNEENANNAMLAATKGRYGLQLGDGIGDPKKHIKEIKLLGNSAEYNSRTIDDAAFDRLFGTDPTKQESERKKWDRILIFAPEGMSDSDSLTAYASFPARGTYGDTGMRSVYGRNFGNKSLNVYLHEMGHHFGFHHSSNGNHEYGDRTCVMGFSNYSARRSEVFNAAKLYESNWLDNFQNATVKPSHDGTVRLYPLSSDFTEDDKSIIAAISDESSTYHISYLVDDDPYGNLRLKTDHDRVFVHTRLNQPLQRSYQVANLGQGDNYSDSGPFNISFIQYGPDRSYAEVSIDLDDGNAPPVATEQIFETNVNIPLVFTLSGTDVDKDPLTYEIAEHPSNGKLSGNLPHLTYTPAKDFAGEDSFGFTVNDGRISSLGTIDVRVIRPPLPGSIELDDPDSTRSGTWSTSTRQTPYVGDGYRYAGTAGTLNDGSAMATWGFTAETGGVYQLNMAYTPGPSRATNVPLTVTSGAHVTTFTVDQTVERTEGSVLRPIGIVELVMDEETVITVGTSNTTGYVILDAVQLVLISAPLNSPEGTFQMDSSGQANFTIETVPNIEYRLVYKNDLTSTNGWIPVAPQNTNGWIKPIGESIMISDPDAADHTQRFYRIEARMPSAE